MLGYYNYTVILTYVGMLSSFCGLLLTFNGKPQWALVCLMFSGFCDMFDGRIASTMKRNRSEKAFGIQIDSLSDLICFGVLPAVIVYAFNPGSILTACICGLYVLCALIRLAFFNVDEAERQEQTDAHRETYQGLPVTSSALLFPMFFCGTLIKGFPLSIVMTVLALLVAIAFISPFKLKKPAKLGKAVFIVLGVIVLVLMILALRNA